VTRTNDIGGWHWRGRSGGGDVSVPRCATVTLDCAPKLVYDAASALASCGHAANQGCAAVGQEPPPALQKKSREVVASRGKMQPVPMLGAAA
jgi:hypothetical protein